MPLIRHEKLGQLVLDILKAMKVSEEECQTVRDHMIGANLVGHDSHGVILLPTYADRIKKGQIVPGAPFEIVRESATTARINGHWGFGQVVSTKAMELAIQKAKASDVAAITVFQQSHVGRLADYPLMAAKEGMIGLMACDSGRTSKAVAPYGGRTKRLGTNPLCIALPSDLEAPVFLDMATSAVAAGKINVARNRKEQVPRGWLIDKEGNPTTDPQVFYEGGALLPLGGDQAHKGYGLSFMVETLSGLVTGLGYGIDPAGWHNDGAFMAVFKVDAFRPLEEFKQDLRGFITYLKETPPAAGFQEVLYPGELEYRTEQKRRREGIPVEDETWQQFTTLARSYGITV
ncbi:MAG: Ldh family oxidoreductase [Candidatus Tectomicrobia bacterium]|nr:Ldh family oxidoreductase [Candidatus Tectomicrobia bacterium]